MAASARGVELPPPSATDIASVADLPIPPSNKYPVDWANAGSLGPTGLLAQRGLKSLEYKILSVDAGSPAHGNVLPGDRIVGIDGKLFQPEDYSAEHKSVAKCNRFSEPNFALGRALEEASSRQQGRLRLTVRRGDSEGTVMLQLPSRRGFSPTYPWSCPKSEQVAEAIAARFAREKLPYKRDLFATVWYGLFLLNHDPVTYREKIDEIAGLVLDGMPKIRSGSKLRGFGSGTWVWHIALYGTFLAEYAMITDQGEKLRPQLSLFADMLFDVRMVGNLWGHNQWHNYGVTTGGFVSASSQAGLALLCLKEAGAAIDESALAKVMDALSASIKRSSGQVGYGSSDDGGAGEPFNWETILAEQSQRGTESLMRQGTVTLAMLLGGRTDEARAGTAFMRRMTVCHATHGIAPDWGVLDASRALAATNPAICRQLLDDVRYLLNLSLRWDGGVQLVPYGLGLGKGCEYAVDMYHADRYVPAMWGLVLSMPKKRLYLLSRSAEPGTIVKLPSSSARPRPRSFTARHLTCGGGKAYYAAPDGLHAWGVFQHDFDRETTRRIIGPLAKPPQELLLHKGALYCSTPGCSLWIWDGQEPRELLRFKARKAPAQFTPFADAIYFVTPPSHRGAEGGELWKTDGTKAGTGVVKAGLGTLLGGSAAWQSDEGYAQSLQVALGQLFFVTCQADSRGKPLPGSWALWCSDGTPAGTHKLLTKQLSVTAVDNGNSPRGSYLGIEHVGKLYFSADQKLWESDGTVAGTRESPLGVRSPNNFALFQRGLLMSGRLDQSNSRRGRTHLILVDGDSAQVRSFDPGLQRLHQITVVGDRFFFVGNDAQHGGELWVSQGSRESTQLVREIQPGPAGAVIDNLIGLNGTLYFTASGDECGNELWRSDDEVGARVVDRVPGPTGSLPVQLRVADDRLYFHTTAIIDGRQLWRHDSADPGAIGPRP